MKNPAPQPNLPCRPAARSSLVSLLALGCACLSALAACRDRSSAANAPSAGTVPPTSPVPAPPPASVAGGELLGRSTFTGEQTLPWMPLFLEPAKGEALVKDHGYCARIDQAGKNAWDVQLRHREMTIQKGHTYSVRYTAWASAPLRMRAQIGMSGPPYTNYWSDVPDLTTERKQFSGTFTATAADDPTAEFAFHMGNPSAKVPVTVCIDELHLTDPAFTPAAKAPEVPLPAIRVNQIGYFPKGPKRATWALAGSDAEARAKQAVPFEVVNGAGAVIHRGTTAPFGKDP
ncbi:MAG TPA: carbohydrate binding domain-containing protein, partial [Polyangiaceae bacterium]|nr:carbohydrate binding domain-containing protein [Polyangiaceae bacterium]